MADDVKPPFDPTRPFEAGSDKPPFDPNQPFQAADSGPGMLGAAWEGVKSGLTAGWMPELGAGMGAGMLSGSMPYMNDRTAAEVEKAGGVEGIYKTMRDQARADTKAAQAAHPYAFGAGELGGAAAGMAALPIEAAGASLGARMIQGAKVGATYGGLSGASENGVEGAVEGAIKGGAGGAGGEAVGTGLGKLGSLAYDAFGRPLVGAVRGYFNPTGEAARRVAGAWSSDIPQALAGTGRGLTPTQYVAALKAGEPVLPMDMGETSRALMRWAANADPEARAIITDAVTQRFAQQSDRGGALIRDLVSGGANTAKTAAQLEAEYDAERGAAYGAAYAAGDKPIWSPELERLTTAPSVADAVRGAVNKWRDWQVKDGYGGMNPPVNVTPDGQLQFLGGKGMLPYPNLQLWDYAARNLAGAASAARRAGNNADASRYGGLEQQLKAELDKLVPEFSDARGVAARYFGGNNAIEAGQKAIAFKGDIRDLQRAMAQMKPAEREMFQEAYADAMARRVENVSDNQTIVNRIYNTPQERARVNAVLGPTAADRLGAFVDRERIFDAARNALGNSTTVRQMIEMGLAGSLTGGAAGYLTGDWHNIGPAALAGAAARSGFRSALGYVDRNTARRVAELLTSPDPRGIMQGINAASVNPRLGAALRETASRLSIGSGAQGAIHAVPKLQLPAPAAAEPDQQNIPGPPSQQHNGGAINQKPRAAGGKVEAKHNENLEQKATKAQAHYRHGDKAEHCGICSMFRPPSSCTAVGGFIAKQAVCDFFKRKIARANGGRVDPDNIEHEPSEAQKKAGNYAKDHVHIHGMDISIENAKGHYRRGIDKGGKPWQVKMPAHYGYIKGTVGRDKDHVDVYLGPHQAAPHVYVVDQVDADSKKFDEHKAFLGFASETQARETYKKAFSDGRGHQRIGHVTTMTVDAFKHWLDNGDTTKPSKHAEPKINNSYHIRSGADSGDDGTVFIDRRIPKYSPKLKDKNGNPANLWKYLALHEEIEALHMRKGYDAAHKIATAAEKAAVEADGVSWKAYTAEIDGYLAKIERQKATRLPPEHLHVDPDAAVGHHKSSNKQRTGDRAAA